MSDYDTPNAEAKAVEVLARELETVFTEAPGTEPKEWWHHLAGYVQRRWGDMRQRAEVAEAEAKGLRVRLEAMATREPTVDEWSKLFIMKNREDYIDEFWDFIRSCLLTGQESSDDT